MGIKESVAKKKWCPFVRTDSVGSFGAISANRIYNKDQEVDISHSLCLGSQCMLWNARGKSGKCSLSND